jgi:hypothetical protein
MHLNVPEYQIKEDKQFNQNLHQLLLKKMRQVIIKTEVIIKN